MLLSTNTESKTRIRWPCSSATSCAIQKTIKIKYCINVESCRQGQIFLNYLNLSSGDRQTPGDREPAGQKRHDWPTRIPRQRHCWYISGSTTLRSYTDGQDWEKHTSSERSWDDGQYKTANAIYRRGALWCHSLRVRLSGFDSKHGLYRTVTALRATFESSHEAACTKRTRGIIQLIAWYSQLSQLSSEKANQQWRILVLIIARLRGQHGETEKSLDNIGIY